MEKNEKKNINMIELLEMIWNINFWEMKKIGKKNYNVTDYGLRITDMITTFRAFATSVRELKRL